LPVPAVFVAVSPEPALTTFALCIVFTWLEAPARLAGGAESAGVHAVTLMLTVPPQLPMEDTATPLKSASNGLHVKLDGPVSPVPKCA
jgi:hypothetical protein